MASKYRGKTPIACRTKSNWGGVEILKIDNDGVVCRDNYGKPSKAHSAKIRYNAKGDAYFKHNGRREYLSEYMRCKF